jgi:hypothetical protein
MTDHERIEELLAGYVLRSLSGEDAAEADRMLTDHVPDCAGCRETLIAFQAVSADLALVTDPVDPPEMVLARLHRELEPRERRPRTVAALAVAASVVAVIGLTGTFLQGQRVNTRQSRIDALSNIFRFAEENGAEMVPVGPATQVAAADEVFLFGENVPAPPPGTVYVVWVESGGRAGFLGWFLPDEDGWVYVHLSTGRPYERLFVTIESAEVSPSAPGDVTWEAAA